MTQNTVLIYACAHAAPPGLACAPFKLVLQLAYCKRTVEGIRTSWVNNMTHGWEHTEDNETCLGAATAAAPKCKVLAGNTGNSPPLPPTYNKCSQANPVGRCSCERAAWVVVPNWDSYQSLIARGSARRYKQILSRLCESPLHSH